MSAQQRKPAASSSSVGRYAIDCSHVRCLLNLIKLQSVVIPFSADSSQLLSGTTNSCVLDCSSLQFDSV